MTQKFDRLIVHVGMHKTGSTTLQHMFHGMKRGNVGPMDMIDINNSTACSLWFGSALQLDRMLINLGHNRASAEKHLAKVQARVTRQLKWSRKKELIISAEMLSDGLAIGEGRKGMLMRLKDMFEPHFEKIEVFGYVRPPVAFTTSATQELLKMRPGFITPWAKYRFRFAPLDQVFGRKNVHLRVFDRALLKNGDVVSDFQEWMGWPQKPVKVRDANHSLSAPAAALIHCFQNNRPRPATVKDYAVKAKAVAELSKVKGPKFALTKDVAIRVLEENAEDLAWIEHRMGQKINDVDCDHPTDSQSVAGEDDLKRNAARFAPLLSGGDPVDPPEDPEEANAIAWAALQTHLKL